MRCASSLLTNTRPEPAKADELGNPAGAVAIGLVPRRSQRGFHMPAFHADGRQPGGAQLGEKPGRCWTRFKANPGDRPPETLQAPHDRGRFGLDLALERHTSIFIDDADVHGLKGRVDPDIVGHGFSSGLSRQMA